MRKPTREEVSKAICSVADGTCQSAIDNVMALFEDKPKPKWEEDFFATFAECRCKYKNESPKSYSVWNKIFEIVPNDKFTLRGVEFFIREKLREFAMDFGEVCAPWNFNKVMHKWGL